MIYIRVGLLVLIWSTYAFADDTDNEISEVEKRLFDVELGGDSLEKISQQIEDYEKLLAEKSNSIDSSEKLNTVRLMISLSKEESDELCSNTERLKEYTKLAISFMPLGGIISTLIPNPPISNAYSFIRFHKDRSFSRCAKFLAEKVEKDLTLSRKEKERIQLFKQNIDHFPQIPKTWDRIVRGSWEFLKDKLPSNKESLLRGRKKFGEIFASRILEPCKTVSSNLEDLLNLYNRMKKYVSLDESTVMWFSLVEDCQFIQYRPEAMEQDVFDESYSRCPTSSGFQLPFGL